MPPLYNAYSAKTLKIHFLLTLHSKFCKEKQWRCWKIHRFFSWSILLNDLPKWKTWKCFQYWFCEIHESDFNNGFGEIHESDFNNDFWWNTWKWFQYWSYFPGDQPICEIHESDFNIDFCEIHESDFNIGLIFQVTNLFVKYMKVISTLSFVKYMKKDFNIDFVKYMKVILALVSGLMKTSKGSHTCTVEIWFVNRSQRWCKLLKKVLYVRLRSDLQIDLKDYESFLRKSYMYGWDLICKSISKMMKASLESLIRTAKIWASIQNDGRSKFPINHVVFGKRHHQLLAFSILSKFLTFEVLTMSSSSSNANPNLVPVVEPVVWRTTFKVNGRPITIKDTIIENEDIVVAVARDMILPRDEIILAARIDIEAADQSLALSIRATSSLVNLVERLHAKRLELNTQIPELHHQIENLRKRLYDERRHRNDLERRNQSSMRVLTFGGTMLTYDTSSLRNRWSA